MPFLRAVDEGGAVAAAGNGQPVEPGGPAGVDVPLDADLVPSGAVMGAGRHRAHDPPLLLPARLDLCRRRERSWI